MCVRACACALACLIVRDLGTSKTRRPKPHLGCCGTEKTKREKNYREERT